MNSAGENSVGKEPARQATEPVSHPQTHTKSQVRGHMAVIPALGRQTQEDLWGSLASKLAYLEHLQPVRDPVSKTNQGS